MRPDQHLSRHHQLFFALAGVLSALLAVGSFLYICRARVPAVPPDRTLAVVIAVAAFVVIYRFPLLLSARHTFYMVRRAVGRWLRMVLIVLVAYLLLPEIADTLPRDVLARWALATLPTLLATLVLLRLLAPRVYARAGEHRRAIFLLPGDEAHTLDIRLERSPVLGIEVAGYYGEPTQHPAGAGSPMTRLGSLADAEAALIENRYNVVFVGMGILQRPQAQEQRIAQLLGNSTAAIYLVPEARVFGYFSVTGATIAGVPLLALNEPQHLGLSRALKRGMDLALGALAALAALPLMLCIALAIRLESPGPVLFRQSRYGQNGECITVLKFRSMYVQTPDEAQTVRQATVNDPRITRVGRLLRRTSLDELPQLFNVLAGDMSLVGPRPHAAAHNEMYRSLINGYMLRHSVKPGITGWAQVNGLRGETDTLDKMRRRVEYDHHYIQNWSLLLDVRILLMTLRTLFGDRAAY